MRIRPYRTRYLVAAIVGLAVSGSVVAYSYGATSASVDATCAAPSYDGTTLNLTCTVPQQTVTETVTQTVTETVTVTPSAPPTTTSPTTTTAPPTSSATPTPTPSPTTTAPSSGWPDASNTGVPAGTTLRRVPQDVTSGPGWVWRTIGGEGVLDVQTAGTVLDALDIQGPVYSNGATDARTALKVTVTRSRIRCVNENNFCLTVGPGSTVSDTEVGGGADGTTIIGSLGILTGNWTKAQALSTFTRVNVHHVVQGFRQDGDTLIQDSFVHDMPMGDPGFTDAHSECVFVSAGANNTARHNTMASGNSAVFFVQHGGSPNPLINGLVIDNNRFISVQKNGENSTWGVSVENRGIGSTKPRVTNNVFDRTGWGAGAGQAPSGSVTTGNTYTDGSAVTISNS